MSQPVSPRFQKVVEMVGALSLDEQRQLVEIVGQRLIQYQRAELVAQVAEARQAYQPDQTRRETAPKQGEFAETAPRRPTVVRTGRGLSIAGTRITLYDVMDYLTANWPADLIRDWFSLTDQQMADVMAYIEKNRPEVEAEYQLVLNQAEQVRCYWEARNQERVAQTSTTPPKPGQEEIRAKLAAWKAQLESA
jgi:uncharacterized protein (DUF433 family)